MNKDNVNEVKEYVTFTPPADIVESSSGLKIVMDLPGVCSECLDIDVDNETLTVKAEPELLHHNKAVKYERSFRISNDLDAVKAEAAINDGTLTLFLPKAEHAKVHKIKIT